MSTQDPSPPPPERPYGQPPSAPQYGQQGDGRQPEPPYAGQPAQGGASPYGGSSPYGADGAPRNGVGLAALVVGIIALVLSWVPGVGFLGVVALILGIVGLSRVRKRVASNRGASLAGVILGAVATVVAVLVLIFTIFVVQQVGTTFQECAQLEPGPEQQQCIEDQLSGAQ